MIMNSLDKIWYQNSALSKILLPFSWLFCSLVFIRRVLYWLRILPSKKIPVPVIVVGNISVGGTGKSPLVIWLALKLQEEGYRPGIISRGYKGKARTWPQQVRPDSDPVIVGDEPVLIARRTNCPMAVGPDRVEAARQLIKYHNCDVIISDDGLQHYRLRRDIEIAVIDQNRGLGNNRCLPAGPLREPRWRLKRVHFTVINNQRNASADSVSMYLDGDCLVSVKDEKIQKKIDEFKNLKNIHAIAGIGNPKRFFNTLEEKGIKVLEHPFADHYQYSAADFQEFADKMIIMTEKDAVKVKRFCGDNSWYLPVEAKVQKGFKDNVLELLKRVKNG